MTEELVLETPWKNTQGLWNCRIRGPKGTVEIRDLVWIRDRRDIVELYYWQSQAVLEGAYHCCFSIPGKVLRIE
jgi:hypothetical protein